MSRLSTLAATLLFSTTLTYAQFGRGGGDWMNPGFDAQRSFWIRSDAKISREGLQKPGFQMIWKIKLDDGAKQAFEAPVLLNSYIGYRGFRSLGFFGVSSDKVVAVDTDLGHVEWKQQLPASQSSCGDSMVAIARPTNAAFPPQMGGGGRGGRGGAAAKSAVGEAGEGGVTIRQVSEAAAAAGRAMNAAPGRGGDGRGGRAANPFPPGFGRMPTVLDAITRDGMLHSILVSNGEATQPATRFLPANTRLEGLLVVDNVAYAASAPGCSTAPNAIVALDVASKDMQTYQLDSGDVAGSVGPAIGPDGTVYVTTTRGQLLALEAKTLKLKDTYNAGQPFTSSPVLFEFNNKTLIAAATRDGNIHLIDAASPSTALSKAPAGGSGVSTLATWQDGTTRWLLAPTDRAVVAWKIADQNGTPALQQGWTSRDLAAPTAPAIVNGVAFSASTGSSPVLYAFDAATGKELWNSGKSIQSALRGGSISAGNSQVYLGTNDGTLYVFGFPMEH
jgi:outer membrane protein assembly factor BamB